MFSKVPLHPLRKVSTVVVRRPAGICKRRLHSELEVPDAALACSELVETLNKWNVSYAIIGDFCLRFYGVQCYTSNVDVLLSSNLCSDWKLRLPFSFSYSNINQWEHRPTGVKINLMYSGKPLEWNHGALVRFPNPASEELLVSSKVKFFKLPTYLNMKLVSGMCNEWRAYRDLADVQSVIEARQLTIDFAEQLHPLVRHQFQKLVELNHKKPPHFPN